MSRESTTNSYIVLGVQLVIGLVFMFILWSLSKNLIEMTKLDERLINAREEVDILVQENHQLQQQATEVDSASHEESLIRNRLGLVRPNETVVIIPQDSIQTLEATPTDSTKNVAHIDLPIWIQWIQLFF